MSVTRITDLRTLPEKGVGFVEQEHTVRLFSGREDLLKSLLCFPDVFVDNTGEIYVKQGNTELTR